MNRLFWITMFWTLLIGIPATALAVFLAGLLSLYGLSATNWIFNWGSQISYIGRAYSVEIWTRMPEVAGALAGLIVMLITVWIAREPASQSNDNIQRRK